MENELVHKDLSYQIVGVLFEVYNDLGYGYKESHYENAIAASFKEKGIIFSRQLPLKIEYKGEIIGKYFLDFLVDSKVVLELKKGQYYSRKNIEQVLCYLKATNKKLAILANFTPNGVKYKRIINGLTK